MDLTEELANFPFIQYLTDVKLSDGLLNGEISSVLLVCCSDMGAQLPYVCSSAKANLLIFQNFGHKTNGIAEHVLYNQVSNVIVYGHTDCKLMQFLVNPDESIHVERDLIAERFAGEPGASVSLKTGKAVSSKQISELRVLNELKALLQTNNLLKNAEKLKIILHAWVYDAEKRELNVYSPCERRFVAAK